MIQDDNEPSDGTFSSTNEDTSTNCQTFANGTWSTCHTLLRPRANHTSWSSRAGVVLLGGSASPATTELLSDYHFQVRGRMQNGSINIFKGQFHSYSNMQLFDVYTEHPALLPNNGTRNSSDHFPLKYDTE